MKKRTSSLVAKKRAILKFRPVILKVAREYGATNVRVFGSYARGEQTKRSDIDLLVHMPEESTLFDMGGLFMDLQDALGKKVDVISEDSIKPALRESILEDARAL